MKIFKTEDIVEKKIAEHLLAVGCDSRVSVFADEQNGNTTTRTVIFKTVIALKGSEAIVNAMVGIGADNDVDRGITYGGSKVEAGEGGENRILFFQAKIDPNEEEY